MQNNSIHSTNPNEWVTLSYEGKPIRVVIKDNEFIWASATDIMDALAYKNQAQELARLAPVHILKNEQIRLENGDLIQIDITNKMGIEALIKYAKASIRKPFKEWYYTHICRPSATEIRTLAQQPQQQSNQQSIDFQIFTFEEGDNIRVFLDEKGNPWFVALDVCKILGLSNVGQAMSRLDEDEKNSIILDDGNRGNPNQSLVNESGLYSLILGSKKPEAKAFKKWVTSEVLPTLRKTGKYEIVPKQETTAVGDFTPAQIETLRKILQEHDVRYEARFQALETFMAYVMSVLPALLPQQYEGEPSYCYLGQNVDNLLCKIGKANLPPDRVWELEAGGSKINLLKTVKLPNEETAFFIEKFFHTIFTPFTGGREWYKLKKAHIEMFVKIADLLNAYYEDLMRRLEKGGDTA